MLSYNNKAVFIDPLAWIVNQLTIEKGQYYVIL